MGTGYAQKVFTEILNRSNAQLITPEQANTTGWITSIGEFIELVVAANTAYNEALSVPRDKQIVFAEDFPKELLAKLNNDTADTDLASDTLRDIRVVTYTAHEEPAIISAHSLKEDGVRSIKWRFSSIYPDPEYTGYSVLRSIKDVQVDVTFKVWGNFLQDIRERSKILRDMLDSNTWLFLNKGVKSIVWTGSTEEEVWDGKNLTKFKSEKYQLRLSEIKELRQKNLEQVIIQMGLGE